MISAAALRLLEGWLSEQPSAAVRLLGVGVTALQVGAQADLFAPAAAPAKDARLDTAIDGIRDRFGSGVLTRASLLPGPADGAES